ncbi:MAG TPA: type II toxin-antitoxin system HipA family toxin [Micavibrio sp.]|jgi:serine/threonine-protein kinase HipA
MTLVPEIVHVKLGAQKIGRLAVRDRRILFEYDRSFLDSGIELSPFKLSLKPGIHSNADGNFDGLFGLFNDSLPDGWGRLLQDRQLRQRGIAPEIPTPLDRLAHVGNHGMGALCYEPDYSDDLPPSALDLDQLAGESMAVLEGGASDVLAKLIALNGSSAGARPKVMATVSDDKERISSAPNILNGSGNPWIIKFPARQDQHDIGPIEYAYSLMAKAAGVIMPETHLFSAAEGAGYFGARRFDRRGSERMHVHTVCGLLHADHRVPSLDYEGILRAAMHLTKSMSEVETMLRLAVFNVLTHNRDDHSKNFSFLMEPDGSWKAAPAYDLTFSAGPGGEHSTTIMGEGRNPTPEHLQRLGKKMDIARSDEIIEQVQTAVSRWKNFAREAGVSKESRDSIGKVIEA